MKTLLLLALALAASAQAPTKPCCPGCICGVNINDRLRSVAKVGGAKIAAVAPGLKYQDVLQVKKQVVAGLMYTFILKFQNEQGQNVYYTAKVYDHFGKISLESYKNVSENWVNSQVGNDATKPVMGCCYQVGFGSRMVKNYNSFEDKEQGKCAVGERIGGATRFEKDNCDNVKLRLGVNGGAKAPTKGCCYDVGYGAYMKKSYDNFKLAAKEDCNAQQRLGGATIFDKRDCDTVKLELARDSQKRPVLGGGGAENAVLTGGWHDVDPSSAVAQTAGQFGADHIKSRINTLLSNCKVKSCMSQVVAGVNYKLVLECDEMGIQKKSFAVAVFRGLNGSMKVTEFHELGNLQQVRVNVPFKPCPGKTGTVTIKSCDATSWPPTRGKKETITANGTGTKTVTGGKWSLKATWKGFTVLSDNGNVCDSVKGGCPAPAGAFSASVGVSIPAVEPSGHYVVTISATDQDGAVLFCDMSEFDD